MRPLSGKYTKMKRKDKRQLQEKREKENKRLRKQFREVKYGDI